MKIEPKLALSIIAKTSEILIENGAETYRIEDTINRMLSTCEFEDVQCFVVPTGIFISVQNEIDTYSLIRRIKRTTIDLEKIEKINKFSRSFSDGDIDYLKAQEILEEIDKSPTYSENLNIIAGGLTSGFFSVVFGGTAIDLLFGFIIGIILKMYLVKMKKLSLGFFIDTMIAAFIASVLSILFSILFSQINENVLVIGAIMQLVPGVLITNSIRDSISGEIIAGLAKASEAIFISIAIALGVILPMYILPILGGIL